jgi:hypothetical protein
MFWELGPVFFRQGSFVYDSFGCVDYPPLVFYSRKREILSKFATYT